LIHLLEEQFSQPLLRWYDVHGRKNLPWQLPRDPYRVWISEIMLQQTQVHTVIPYFNRFIERFPVIHDLAQADEDTVLAYWSGLGYYSRARNLHKTAQIISKDFAGHIPENLQLLMTFPGIGPSTAAAILSQAYNHPTAILDGNVKRVLTRFFRIEGWPEKAAIKKVLWELADECMPQERCADYTQAIMDLGATCCTLKKPDCSQCPVQRDCQALKHKEQHLLPTKKTKKAIPVYQKQFLVLCNQEQMIFLEKKPPAGVWGGLWCLPSIDKDRCPLSYIQQHYDIQGEQPKHLTSLKHRFSHFHLEIDAILIKATHLQTKEKKHKGQWFTKEKLTQVGIAKPITQILKHLLEMK
jgi:A/G-specific adenine glycosylase